VDASPNPEKDLKLLQLHYVISAIGSIVKG